jgi:predicted amidohydrolase
MRISLIQDIIHWADKTANLQKTEVQIAALSGKTDLVVLPEMFTTGFCTDKLHLAENRDGGTIKSLQNWAKKYEIAIAGSFIAVENQQYFNRAFFVLSDGNVKIADKRHLFSMGGEQNFFTAGDKRLIIEYCGFKICLLVCYDLRFPVWSRNVNNEYDLLIYVANFPKLRIRDWDILLQARAIENQTYVCGVNRVGEDGAGIRYNGHSILLDYNAKSILTFPENETSIQTCEIRTEPLKIFRNKFSVWKDADKFEIV